MRMTNSRRCISNSRCRCKTKTVILQHLLWSEQDRCHAIRLKVVIRSNHLSSSAASIKKGHRCCLRFTLDNGFSKCNGRLEKKKRLGSIKIEYFYLAQIREWSILHLWVINGVRCIKNNRNVGRHLQRKALLRVFLLINERQWLIYWKSKRIDNHIQTWSLLIHYSISWPKKLYV
jgi:hypothetical protein